MTAAAAFYPELAPIDAYGNGGFRFADMSHRGSILCIPSGIYAWSILHDQSITLSDLQMALDNLAPPSFLLLGTGNRQFFPSPDIRTAFIEANIGLEAMSTGAACRTFNVLLAEGRPVAAALLAVE